MGEEVANITVENEREPGTFSIQKVSDRQPDVTLSGAEFSLYKSNGEFVKGGYITGADGTLKLENLQWGSYYLKETKAPDGYNISDEKIEFTINAENNAGKELETVTVENEQIPAKAKLVKYELKNPYDKVTSDAELNTEKPLKGAVYALYKESEPDNPITRKVTDKDGAIYVEDLTFGKYYFQEISAPAGYKLYEDEIHFTVGAEDTAAEIKTVVQTADSRKTGTVSLTKTATGTGDTIHAATKVGNAVYRLYLSTDTAFANPLKLSIKDGKYHYDESGTMTDMLTDETEGFIEIFDLPWNSEENTDEKYVLKEYKTPKGYSISDKKFEFRIDANSVSKPFIWEDEDEQKKGTVKLVKTDTSGNLMEGVVFTLYREDGSIYSDDITTGADGTVEVENIPWGSYYFVEKEAADAGLNDKKFRFVVNNDNAGRTQEIQIEDPMTSFQFTVTKKIKKSDIVFEHGNPTFIFEAKNTSDNHIYRKAVAFNEDSLNIVGDYVTASVIFVVPTGTYEVSEVSVNRYAFKEITFSPPDETGVNVDNSNKKVTFKLDNDTKNIEFIFENEKFDQSGTSDSDLITNTLNKDRTLISIAAEYNGKEFLTDDVVLPKDVTVYAFYDNGTQEELQPDSDGKYPYTIGPVDAGKPNTDQLVEVSYTEGTTTRTDFITVKTGYLSVFEYVPTGDEPPDGYDGVISIYQYTGKASVVKFPASLTVITESGEEKTYKVKAVAPKEIDTDWIEPKPNVFSNPNNVTSIIFAEGIEEIGTATFNMAYGLKNIILSTSIKKIGQRAFYYKGESLTILEGSQLEEIGEEAFSYTKISGELKLPATLKTIGGSAFKNCSYLTSLEFAPDSKLETIGDYAFSSSGLSGDLTIPKSVKTIENSAFQSAYTSAGTLRFEDGSVLTTIGNNAFDFCKFTALDFGKQGDQGLTIGDEAFSHCSEIVNLTIPANVVSIGNKAFSGLRSGDRTLEYKLASLTFAEGSRLDRIGDEAFKSCNNQLTGELRIPASVRSIGNSAFANCTGLTSLVFEDSTEHPSKLTEIKQEAFKECTGLTGDLIIPDNVTNIGDNAFYNCLNIKGKLKVSNNIVEIGASAFRKCCFSELFLCSKTLKKVGGSAFYNDSNPTVGTLILPLNVEMTGNYSFWNCSKVTTLYYSTGFTTSTYYGSSGIDRKNTYTDYDDLRTKLGADLARQLGVDTWTE